MIVSTYLLSDFRYQLIPSLFCCCVCISMSNFHIAVCNTLSRLGVRFSNEVKTEDGLFSMDIGLHPARYSFELAPGHLVKLGTYSHISVGVGDSTDQSTATCSSVSPDKHSNSSRAGCGMAEPSEYATYNGLKVAIEVDGKSHFTCNTRRVLGPTLARGRLLRARNWYVVSIPGFEWEGLNSDIEREHYMQRKLAGLGVTCRCL